MKSVVHVLEAQGLKTHEVNPIDDVRTVNNTNAEQACLYKTPFNLIGTFAFVCHIFLKT